MDCASLRSTAATIISIVVSNAKPPTRRITNIARNRRSNAWVQSLGAEIGLAPAIRDVSALKTPLVTRASLVFAVPNAN